LAVGSVNLAGPGGTTAQPARAPCGFELYSVDLIYFDGHRCLTRSLAIAEYLLEVTMNWDQIEGQWKQSSGKIKEKWGKLTDDDLAVINGKKEQLVGKIQQHYGIAKDVAEKQIDDFTRDHAWDVTPSVQKAAH
jgi:uncharacterized protein YjbJ (UPF0337 family)